MAYLEEVGTLLAVACIRVSARDAKQSDDEINRAVQTAKQLMSCLVEFWREAYLALRDRQCEQGRKCLPSEKLSLPIM